MVEWAGLSALCQRGLRDAGEGSAWRQLTSASERERGGREREEAVILPHSDRKAHKLQG